MTSHLSLKIKMLLKSNVQFFIILTKKVFPVHENHNYNCIHKNLHNYFKNRDICCSAGDLCTQQPNLAPIQSNDEVVSFKLQISWRQPIEKTVKILKKNNYKQKNIDLFFFIKMRSTVWTKKKLIFHQIANRPFAI